MIGGLGKKTEFTVKELSSILSQVLSSELFMNIALRGEIISKAVKNRVIYMTLADSSDKEELLNKKPTIRVVLFDWYAKNITCSYEEGDEVIVTGSLNYYAPSSSVSLRATDIVPCGEGEELLRLKRLEEKLAKEGLFAPERKRPLPKSIKKIGIITSGEGAAYHDIMETLSRKVPVSTVLFDCLVQGKSAPESMIRALDKAYHSDCDILIFGRGGGSKSDLSCFNDEDLVRKLAASPIPVITGIGHEIDRSLCDLAADVYAITPTAAADCALENLADVLLRLQMTSDSLLKACNQALNRFAISLYQLKSRLAGVSPEARIAALRLSVMSREKKAENLYNTLLVNRKMALYELSSLLEKNYKLSGLKAGQSLILLKGKPVLGARDLKKGDKIELGFADGYACSTVDDVNVKP